MERFSDCIIVQGDTDVNTVEKWNSEPIYINEKNVDICNSNYGPCDLLITVWYNSYPIVGQNGAQGESFSNNIPITVY